MFPGEKSDAELRFQRLDLAADCRLGEKQFGRCPGETQMTRGGIEALERVERRQAADAVMHAFCS